VTGSGEMLIAGSRPDRRSAALGDRRQVVGEGSDEPDGYAYAYVLTDEERRRSREPVLTLPARLFVLRRSREQVPRLFSGRGVRSDTGAILAPVYICNQCVAACAEVLAERSTKAPP
jgi:hypothetical protein